MYSKIMLTIVAVCLLYIVAKDISLVPNAHADAPVKVDIVAISGFTFDEREVTGYKTALPVSQR